jgi:hypothetical protein
MILTFCCDIRVPIVGRQERKVWRSSALEKIGNALPRLGGHSQVFLCRLKKRSRVRSCQRTSVDYAVSQSTIKYMNEAFLQGQIHRGRQTHRRFRPELDLDLHEPS